jgi:hypothetical protein
MRREGELLPFINLGSNPNNYTVALMIYLKEIKEKEKEKEIKEKRKKEKEKEKEKGKRKGKDKK